MTTARMAVSNAHNGTRAPFLASTRAMTVSGCGTGNRRERIVVARVRRHGVFDHDRRLAMQQVHRRKQAIAYARHRFDVARRFDVVVERATQFGDRLRQDVWRDHAFGPDAVEQLPARDSDAAMTHEFDQHGQRLAAEPRQFWPRERRAKRRRRSRDRRPAGADSDASATRRTIGDRTAASYSRSCDIRFPLPEWDNPTIL